MTYRYYCNCVNWPSQDVWCKEGLHDLIESRVQVSRRTLLRHVDHEDLAMLQDCLGYGPHLHMCNDYHVEYFRSKLHGRRVYGFRHSAIEYVFTGVPQ